MDYFEKFEERLPRKGKFYSSLTGKRISDETINMFLKFGINLMKAMTDSLDLYFKYDVFLLVDVLEKLRNNCFKNCTFYRSIHYLSAPDLNWDGMLNVTKAELDLVSDVDNLEKGMRGSVSYISKRS